MNERIESNRIDWLNDWLIDWLNDWLIDWLIEWMNEWMNEWTNERMNEWMNEWMLNSEHEVYNKCMYNVWYACKHVFLNEHVMTWCGLLISHHDNTTIEVRCLWSMVGFDPAVKHTNMGDVFRFLCNTIYDRKDDVSRNRDRVYLYIFMYLMNKYSFQTLWYVWYGCFRQILKRHLGVSNRCHLSNDFWWTNGVFSPRWDPWMVNLLTWIVVVFSMVNEGTNGT